MFKIIAKQPLGPNVKRVDIRAEALAAKLKPGQFVTVMVDEYSRRLPFNVFEVDWRRKCLSIVFEENLPETKKLAAMKLDDEIFAVSGPYGKTLTFEKMPGNVLCVGEGMGLSSLVPLCRSYKQAGTKVIGIAGFESRKGSILENQMRLYCSKFFVMYKDGMHERKGDVLTPLKKVMTDESISLIYADTSFRMLEDVKAIAASKNVPVFINVMPLIASEGVSFFETNHVILNGQKFYPALDGTLMDAARIDLKLLTRQMDSFKEYNECRKKDAVTSSQLNAFGLLKKLVWG